MIKMDKWLVPQGSDPGWGGGGGGDPKKRGGGRVGLPYKSDGVIVKNERMTRVERWQLHGH